MVLIDKQTGQKLYPVCRWEDNQHKLDYLITTLENEIEEDFMQNRYDESKESKLNRIRELLVDFNGGVHKDGLVYMTYKEGQEVKALIAGYDFTHKF